MAILDAIFNTLKRSLMSEWHQLDSSSTMPEQHKSTKNKTLKPSSRSYWFYTRLKAISYHQTIHTELFQERHCKRYWAKN